MRVLFDQGTPAPLVSHVATKVLAVASLKLTTTLQLALPRILVPSYGVHLTLTPNLRGNDIVGCNGFGVSFPLTSQ
jgi:hypothetical protein